MSIFGGPSKKDRHRARVLAYQQQLQREYEQQLQKDLVERGFRYTDQFATGALPPEIQSGFDELFKTSMSRTLEDLSGELAQYGILDSKAGGEAFGTVAESAQNNKFLAMLGYKTDIANVGTNLLGLGTGQSGNIANALAGEAAAIKTIADQKQAKAVADFEKLAFGAGVLSGGLGGFATGGASGALQGVLQSVGLGLPSQRERDPDDTKPVKGYYRTVRVPRIRAWEQGLGRAQGE